ncbi:MAG TPA: HAMP domain-containing sensor histidine kinase [Balneolaceae bacterium]|nr:HAMP domain-containing sensor histidine kinase [Balneolaceae bacterium]
MKRYGSLRWILLTAGVIAILGLTGMNVYSLYALHNNTLESDRENKKLQISEFTDKIRYRFFEDFNGLGTSDIKRLEKEFNDSGQFTGQVTKLLDKAAADSIYTGIYFIPTGSNVCHNHEPMLKYKKSSHEFYKEKQYSDVICDGMGIARTQMKSLVNQYNYNNKIIFDSHRSITIAMVTPSNHSIFGYLTMPVNQEFLRHKYLPQKLTRKFGHPQKSGMNVWLRDWTTNKVIASSNPDATYNRHKIQYEQNFPDFFDYWKLEVSFTDTPTLAASNASLFKNLVVLGAAVILLLGALVFMFISAQKERALAERQAGFLANVTHELKTPLAVMQAAGENLADGRVKDETRVKNYGNHIFSEAVRLRKMIEKLLDVAKADAGQSLIEPQPANIKELVNSYLDEHQKYIENKGFEIHLSLEDELPMVMVDIDSFEAIISNLVENAIKYTTNEKYLGITLHQKDRNVQLQIADHGVGMDKKDISHIFDKFYRAEDTLTAKTKGHGLGLSIVKNLVELNGGTINVKSEPGEGSIFFVTFPILVDTPEPDGDISSASEINIEPLNEESAKYAS